ncbi:MAG TPA: protein kinase, partial [Silvibacterium sp.]|nr:protein kinase [Silvibacterium sp.]
MKPERWRQIEQLYHSALEQAPAQRNCLLAEACRDDADLRREVESLLAQSGSTQALVDQTAWAEAGDLASKHTVLKPGEALGPYKIQALLGAGGMGEVYSAVDTRLGRRVAIKISQERFSGRFEREARAVSALNHPNICTLYDVGPNYLVTELVEGETLRDWLQRAPDWERCLEVARQVLEALGASHRAGIVHRDLKPQNIMVRFDGYVKVLDFGLAKRQPAAAASIQSTATMDVSVAGQILGTAAYMSPEQIQGREVDPRSDLFAFGIILYEMIARRHPWPRPSALDTVYAILHDEWPPIPTLVDTNLEAILHRCLAKQRDKRFQTAAEIQIALEQAPAKRSPKPKELQPSIAVLPFANMSADKENEYFSDGLAEEIINALAHLPSLKVTSRTSSFFFRGKDVELAEIGRRLNAGHILEGSVRRAGNRIRITAQLIKASDGFHLWSERYDREMTDIFTIQDEITEAITEALRVKLSPQAERQPHREPNLRAYDAYLKARSYWFLGTSESQVRFKESVDRAIALDPEFALPHMLLGASYSMAAHLGIQASRELIPLAQAAEEQALRLDATLPQAHALLGVWAGTFSYDWQEAETRWRLAMACEPVSHDVRFWYGNHYLLPLGRAAEAVEAMAWGLEGDPLNLLYRHHWATG